MDGSKGITRRRFFKGMGLTTIAMGTGLVASHSAFGSESSAATSNGSTSASVAVSNSSASASAATGSAVTTAAAPGAAETLEVPKGAADYAAPEDGVTPIWMRVPDAISDSSIKETYSADVVIVGAGIAGTCAAMSAVEAGLDTVVLQKLPYVFNYATGVASYDCAEQKANGAPDKYDVQALISDYMVKANNIPNRKFIQLWKERSGADMDWLYNLMADQDIDQPAWGWDESEPIMGMFSMIKAMPLLASMAQEKGAKFFFSTPAIQLIREDGGNVTGVIGVNDAGEYLKFEASKGVILCAGDYGNNAEMRKEFLPHAEGFDSAVDPKVNTGDGELLGMWVGAAMDKKPHCTNIHYDLIDGTLDQIYGAGLPWLKVNSNGERFSNEDVNYGYIPYQDASQPGCTHIDIFDSDYETYQPQLGDGLYRSYPTPSETAPVFIQYLDDNGIDHSGMSDYTAMLEAYVQLGEMYRADTIEELAGLVNVPADTLKATVDRYNELVAAKNDDDFGKPADYLFPIAKAPFYAVPRKAYSLSCLSGLMIDQSARVLDSDGNVIPGLYAAGNNSGGQWFGGLMQPMTIPGVPSSRAVILARVAIETISGTEAESTKK